MIERVCEVSERRCRVRQLQLLIIYKPLAEKQLFALFDGVLVFENTALV